MSLPTSKPLLSIQPDIWEKRKERSQRLPLLPFARIHNLFSDIKIQTNIFSAGAEMGLLNDRLIEMNMKIKH